MPDGGLDIATLGLRVDAREFVQATKAVDDFAAAGVRAEKQAQSLGRSASSSAKVAAIEARNAARAQVEALEREFQIGSAEIKSQLIRGFITPKEAERAGREAAQAYNQALVRVIDSASNAGGLNRNAKAGADAFLELSGSFKNVGTEGRKAGLGLGRLNDAMVTVARQSLGLNSVSGKLIDTIGTFAIGTAYMVPVLAGLAAIGFAWEKITEESRRAREEQDKAIESGLQAARLRALGPAGSTADELAAAQARLDRLRRRSAELEAQGPPRATGQLGANVLAFEREVQETDAAIKRAEEAVKELRQQVQDSVGDAQDRINADRDRANAEAKRDADEAARIAEQHAERLQRLADETARREQVSANVVANLDQQIDAETRLLAANQRGADAVEGVNRELEREQALREALANAVPADVARIERQVNALYDLKEANEQAADLRERTSKEFVETGKQLEAAWDRLRQQERERAEQAATLAQAWRDAWVDAAVDIGRAISDSAGNAAAFLGNLDIGNAIGGGGLAALNPIAIPGFLAGGVAGILSGREERARAVEQARLEFERVLDAYVDELADATRWERLEADALSGAQDAFSSLLDSLFADLASRGSFGAEAAQRIKDQLSGAVDLAGLEAVLSQFGPQGQAILEEYRKKLERIEEQRQKEIETMSQNLQVETLRLQGLDEEANALALSIRYHDLMAQALELNDSALQALIESWYEAAQAADEAAKAAEAEAKAKRDAATRDDFLANLGILQAQNAGDDLGAFQAAQEFAAKQKIAEAQRLFAEGIIDEDTLNAFIEAIGVQLTNALKDAEEAAIAAAEAEQFRAYQDMQNLQIRLLIAQGMTEEAFLLRQRLELEEAIAAGRSEAYIALLLQVQAEERAARERARNAAALQEQNRAMEESTRSIDGMTRALNGPAGLVLALRRFQTIRGAGAPNALGIDAPTYQGRGGASIQIAEGAIVIQGGTQDPKAIADAVVNRITQEARAGAGNRVVNVIA